MEELACAELLTATIGLPVALSVFGPWISEAALNEFAPPGLLAAKIP